MGQELSIQRIIQARGAVRAKRGDRVVSFRSSTPDLDRHGTRVLPMGIQTENYDRNPIFLWGHDGYGGLVGGPSIESVIGRTIGHQKSREAFDHDVEFVPADVNPKAEMALRLVQLDFLGPTSIGFEPKRFHEEAQQRGAAPDAPPVVVFDEVDLLEVSLVPIPSNPHAQALARAMYRAGGLDRALDVVQDDDLASRIEIWVRSAVDAEQSRQSTVHPTAGEQSSQPGEGEQSSPSVIADLITNLAVREWRPTLGTLLRRACDTL